MALQNQLGLQRLFNGGINDALPEFGFKTRQVAFYPDATIPPTFSAYQAQVQMFEFSDTLVNAVHAQFLIPYDYAPNTNILLKAHFSPNSAAPLGDVRWAWQASFARGYSQDLFFGPASLFVNVPVDTQFQHYTTFIPVAFGAGLLEPDAAIILRLARLGNNVQDTYTGTVHLIDISLQYLVDRIAVPNGSPVFY